MPTSIEALFIIFSALIILSIFTIKLSVRFGIPSLVLFIVIGMLAGSDGPGGLYFDNPQLVQTLGVIALVLILFSGGLDTEWNSVRLVLWNGLSLSTIGVVAHGSLGGMVRLGGPRVVVSRGTLAGGNRLLDGCRCGVHGATGQKREASPDLGQSARAGIRQQ